MDEAEGCTRIAVILPWYLDDMTVTKQFFVTIMCSPARWDRFKRENW